MLLNQPVVRIRHDDGKSSAKIAEEPTALEHNIKPSTVRSYVRIYKDEKKGVIRRKSYHRRIPHLFGRNPSSN